MWRLEGHYSVRRTTCVLLFCIVFLAGVALARRGYDDNGIWAGFFGFGMIISLRRHSIITIMWVLLFGLALGWWRGSIYMHKLDEYSALFLRPVTITAIAMNDGVYGKNSQMQFDAKDVTLSNGRKLTGKVSVSGFGLNAVYQGDEVKASGKLYPSPGSYQARLSFAPLHLIAHHPSLLAEVRRKFAAGMQSALPEPIASFAMGLLIGQRVTLATSVKQTLLMVGLTHIIAVSGYNLTIMLNASKHLFAKQSKRLSMILSFTLMGIFLLLAGGSASIVRAAIVSTLSIGTRYYGREMRPLNLILLAATITAWMNPFYLWSDTSWYLSFLAFFGVLVLAPLIHRRLPRFVKNSLLVSVAIESLSAETMTLPFVLHIFGQMSFIGLLANVLVVTLVPLAMLVGMVAGLAGMFLSPWAGWLAWPAKLLLTCMLDIASMLARIPHVFVQNVGLSLIEMLCMYAVVLAVIAVLHFKSSVRAGIITDTKELAEGV